MFSQKNTFSSDIFSITVVNRKINSHRYQQCLSSSNQYRSILESFPNPSPMSGWKHWRPTPVSAPRKDLQRKTPLRQKYFLLAGSSISYILPKYLCAGSCILHIYEIFQIFKYLCAGQNICVQAQDTDKTIRKARERVAAGGKRETIKRLEVNQSIVRSDKVMNII